MDRKSVQRQLDHVKNMKEDDTVEKALADLLAVAERISILNGGPLPPIERIVSLRLSVQDAEIVSMSLMEFANNKSDASDSKRAYALRQRIFIEISKAYD